jgi:4-aminobutyrate aminotransferase
MRKEGDVGAVIVETIRSTDVQIPPVNYYKELRKVCDRHGALLIVDEIPIALGRTGKLFAIEHYGIEPDILVLGKGLGGGTMPLAAMIARAKFDVAQKISIGHYTHEKNPVACAAGVAVLETIEQDGLLLASMQKGNRLMEHIRSITKHLTCIKEVRGIGLLIGIELLNKPTRKASEIADAVLYRCLSKGLSFKVGQGNVLVLCPPLITDECDLEWAASCIAQALEFEG